MADDLVTWATIKAMEGDALLLRWLKGFKQELNLTINRYFERGTSRGWVGGLDVDLLYHQRTLWYILGEFPAV